MWKIMNKFFGWDYVVFTFGFSSTVRRVRFTFQGDPYVQCYGEYLFINVLGARKFTPLTECAFMKEATDDDSV